MQDARALLEYFIYYESKRPVRASAPMKRPVEAF